MTVRIAALLLLVAPAMAEDVPSLEDLELLPCPELRWELMEVENRELFERFEHAHNRADELNQRLREDEGNPWLTAAFANAERRRLELWRQLRGVLLSSGMDVPDSWDHFPRQGPRRPARHAHDLVTRMVPEGKKRELLSDLANALDAAQLALVQQSDRVARLLAEEDGPRRDQLLESFEAAIERSEHRFWLVVDAVLSPDQRRELRALLPRPFQTWDEPFDHMLFLPGITPSQSGRLRAQMHELASETAADEAKARRLERVAEDDSLPEEERERAGRELHDVWLRTVKLHAIALERARKILSDEQYDAFLAIPPRVPVDLRLQAPGELVEGFDLDKLQIARLGPLVERSWTAAEKLERAMGKLERERKDLGPESPQMQAMEMKEAAVMGGVLPDLLAIKGKLFLDVLLAKQVVAWMLALESGEDQA